MRVFSILLAVLQVVFAIRAFGRMARTANGSRIARATSPPSTGSVAVLLPVLDEEKRLSPCLEGLAAQGPSVGAVLVIDGGSTDGTRGLVRRWAERDTRIRLIDGAPVPAGVNGKAYNLETGIRHLDEATEWVLTIDADVRPAPDLVPSLLAHAHDHGIDALSVATQQELSGAGEGVLHPSMLATLVYRFGIPGHATADPAQVQANGQCFLVRRDVLDKVGGFSGVLHDVSEDVTLARLIAMQGTPVGFYESDDLVRVEMYASAREAWDNWTRSLPMRDRFTPVSSAVGLLEATLVQALPAWLAPILLARLGRGHPATLLNIGLLAGRFGVLAGMSRAYRQVPWTYWFSPFADIVVMGRIWQMWSRRVHSWRGRHLVAGDTA